MHKNWAKNFCVCKFEEHNKQKEEKPPTNKSIISFRMNQHHEKESTNLFSLLASFNWT